MNLRRNRITYAIAFQAWSVVLAFVMLYPILWLIGSSLKESSSVFVSASVLIPRHVDLTNYVEGWKGFGSYNFTVFFRNSFIITFLSTIGWTFSSAVVAYGFARIRFRGRAFWFVCMMLTLMLPDQVLLIPQYVLFHRFGWINTFLPLVVPRFLGYPFFIFLMMQFIRGIPLEIDESAVIDGANKYGIFFRLMLPLMKPAVFTTAIFAFYWSWDDFIGPLIYLSRPALYPVSLALKLFSDPSAVTNWGAMFAMSTLSLIPIFLIFLLFQRNIVEGISTTGLKG